MRRPLYSLGVFVGLVAVVSSLLYLHLGFDVLYDFVALAAVIGGTIAVAIAALPWDKPSLYARYLARAMLGARADGRSVLESCLKLVVDGKLETGKGERIAFEVLRRGSELAQLGIHPDRIEEVLGNIVDEAIESRKHLATSIRALSKYPPAFGLCGTVLGLIHLMRSLEGGMEASQVGLLMSIALLATFYGILVASRP